MGVQDYQGACELVMNETVAEEFNKGFQVLRNTMLSHGFAPEAVDSLDFKAAEYIMTISPEERRMGASHVQADGRPFYVITVESPGSFMEFTADKSFPMKMPVDQQALFLSFEIGRNLLGSMDMALNTYLKDGNTSQQRAGGVSSAVFRSSYETTMRCDPATYMDVLNQFLAIRLNMIAPKPQPPAAKPAKPPSP